MIKEIYIEHLGTAELDSRWRDETLPNYLNGQPIENIWRDLQSDPLNCKTIVFEKKYVDSDYQDEFGAFYCKSFKNYPARCTRLHFFSELIPKNTKFDWDTYANKYLGYMILRPTDLQRVGRTVIVPTIAQKNTCFINCVTKFHAHLFGYRFTVEGMPFIQQDTQVGVCAQASLWMAARYMRNKYGHRHCLPSEITQMATSGFSYGRPIPANGLTMAQMSSALQEMGLPSIIYHKNEIDCFSEHLDSIYLEQADRLVAKLADIAYRNIESGLPVIFGTSDHALVGIGHEYKWDIGAKATIQRIPAFFVNNDNRGCYRRMPIWTDAGLDYSFQDVRCLITIIPAEVSLPGELAEEMARIHLAALLDQHVSPSADLTYKDILSKLPHNITDATNEFEFRTYLMPSIAFQQQLLGERDNHVLPRSMCESIVEMDFPKYVWISEISTSRLLNHPNCEDRQCLGRVIIDSTAPARTTGIMAIHLGGLIARYDRHSSSDHPADLDQCDDWRPFVHKVWYNYKNSYEN